MFGEEEKESATYGKWTVTIQPELHFPLKNERKISIIQNNKGHGELGSRLWDGGLVLARYVESLGKQQLEGKSCIELGSGTGLPSIVALLMGAKIIATDKKALLQLIQQNFEKNCTPEELKGNASYEELLWGTGNPFNKNFDFIIGADLTYDFEDLPVLVTTLVDLSSPSSTVIIAYGKERAATPEFFEQAGKHFDLELIEDSELSFGDIYYPTFSISIVKMKRKTN